MKYQLTLWSLIIAMGASAQDTYLNEQLTSVTDVNGSARYVGMGGALGALGADLSVMSSNPAGIGLFRSTDVGLSFSVLTQADKTAPEGQFTKMSLDNLGFVLANSFRGRSLKYLNFGLNYQKKINYNHAFVADNAFTGGLSQTDQLAYLTTFWGPRDNGDFMFPGDISKVAADAHLILPDAQDVYYGQPSQSNQFNRVMTGGLETFDLNISMNFNDRVYFGATLGIDNVNYDTHAMYTEFCEFEGNYFDYNVRSAQSVSGYGVNGKFGLIVRPIESSAFRLGVTIETPTFYSLESSAFVDIDSHYDEKGQYTPDALTTHYGPDDNYLDYTILTPWKFRFSLGHTVDNFLAVGAEYEFVNYRKARMGYIDYGSWGGRMKDDAMNDHTERTLKAGHNFKLGLEYRITPSFYTRMGYNYYSEAYDETSRMDQNTDSYALDYSIGTDFMNKQDVNIFTFGLGYKHRHFYADIAYKYRMQRASFYAFNDSFTYEDPNFNGDKTARLAPVDVNLDRHQVFFTLGYKF